ESLSPLGKRLLASLLRVPEALEQVPVDVRAAIARHADTDVFAEVVSYVDQNPGADLSELVGRWAGQPIGAELARLADAPHTLPESAVARELIDGLSSYVAGKAREARRRALMELKEAPSAEKLKAWQSLRAETAHSASDSGSNSD
ncbi:MAG TPA: hypothetical protein VIS76_01040, partial [Pseudomonadales bacterium]